MIAQLTFSSRRSEITRHLCVRAAKKKLIIFSKLVLTQNQKSFLNLHSANNQTENLITSDDDGKIIFSCCSMSSHDGDNQSKAFKIPAKK